VFVLGSGVLLAAVLAGPVGSAQAPAPPAVQPSSGAAAGQQSTAPGRPPASGVRPAVLVAPVKPLGPNAGDPAPQQEVLKTYCLTCHNDRTKTGDFSLEHADLTDVPKAAEAWEKVSRKVRAGMMPPAGMPRPDTARLDGFVS
jgi:hypothetical protein